MRGEPPRGFVTPDQLRARRAAREAEAREAEAEMPARLRDAVRAYRDALRVSRTTARQGKAQGAPDLAPCPVCDERSAFLSRADLGAGPTVQLYCDNPDCMAREVDVTIRRAILEDPPRYDVDGSPFTTYRSRGRRRRPKRGRS